MRRLNVPRFFSFHLRLLLASTSIPSFRLPRFSSSSFFKPSPTSRDRHFIFFTSLSTLRPTLLHPALLFSFSILSPYRGPLDSSPSQPPSTPGPSTLVIFIPTLFHYLFAPVHIPILVPTLSLSLLLSSSLFHFSTFITLHSPTFPSLFIVRARPLIIPLFRALSGNSLLFFARFATRAVARATDKFCRDIAFGIIAIMPSTFLAALRRPYRPCISLYIYIYINIYRPHTRIYIYTRSPLLCSSLVYGRRVHASTLARIYIALLTSVASAIISPLVAKAGRAERVAHYVLSHALTLEFRAKYVQRTRPDAAIIRRRDGRDFTFAGKLTAPMIIAGQSPVPSFRECVVAPLFFSSSSSPLPPPQPSFTVHLPFFFFLPPQSLFSSLFFSLFFFSSLSLFFRFFVFRSPDFSFRRKSSSFPRILMRLATEGSPRSHGGRRLSFVTRCN